MDVEKKIDYIYAKFSELRDEPGREYNIIYSEIKTWCCILEKRGQLTIEQHERVRKLEKEADEYTRNMAHKLNLLREAREKLN